MEAFAYPLRFDPVTGFALLELDEPREVEGCAAAILDCPVGWIDSEPQFGTPELAFRPGSPTDVAEVAGDAVSRWLAPRELTELSGDAVDLVTTQINLAVEAANG